jgi:hypothetical protein
MKHYIHHTVFITCITNITFCGILSIFSWKCK